MSTPGASTPLQLPAVVAADPRAARKRGGILATLEGRIAVGLLAFVAATIIVGPALAPYSPTATGVGPAADGASWAHPLGTDLLGRDVLSRLLHGGRSVILVPAIGVALAVVGGTAVGMLLGLAGGWLDATAGRVIDLLLGIPPLLVVLLIAAAFGSGGSVLVIAIAIVFMPRTARVVRGATQSLRHREYVVAAQLRGERLRWVLGRELLPNLAPTLYVELATRLTFAVIFVASLNFLGLGVQPPDPNWGLMVSEARNALYQAPLSMIGPALSIAVLCIGVNLLADALTRALDAPR